MKRILIADDQVAARELLRSVLSRSGYEVMEAVDGLDAAEKALALMPDLILLDIHMPGQNGMEVCAELRRDARLASVPILALTAGLMSGEREKAIAVGFSDFLSKPISISVLREKIASLL